MSWHLLRALLFICEDPCVAQPLSMATRSAAAGGRQGASGGGDHGGHSDADDGSGGDGAVLGGAAGSADPTYTPSTADVIVIKRTGAEGRGGPEALWTVPRRHGHHDCRRCGTAGTCEAALPGLAGAGGDGIAFHGTCDGAPAVIKDFTWELCALAAYWRESVVYRGSVVPLVLAHCKLPYGLRYIALRPIEGDEPRSGCVQPFPRALPRAVAVAALCALQEVQAACPDFVHADNLLLVRAPGRGGAAEGERKMDALGGTAPCCVLLDFARSGMGKSEQQQQRELAQLRQLLGNAAGD
ncbi:hypothetical protein TSOC_005542 [Tetrabaena socialis]|uniref:Protein kinase domain-containing protein n=1 Tax=Tetrabaena socialis TaxID=47790 RepID=A0A2J8A604_9CHLO|nr:hypothetical protein TSOC_005542 [Tetrabaena socialis]|eukprot:PNH07959.1 hypothetical protein TSOC_005542 [Tetrabaena socialis]